MSHFLVRGEMESWKRPMTLGRPIAAVVCRHEREGKSDRLRIHAGDGGGIVVAKVGLALAPLPASVRVVGPADEPVEPSTRFWVTLDTFDPFHLVLDVEDP